MNTNISRRQELRDTVLQWVKKEHTRKKKRLTTHLYTVNGPTYKSPWAIDDFSIIAMGAEMTASMGLNSWTSFAGNKDDDHIAGDIAMLQSEVNPVVNALRQNNLEVVSGHNHMLFGPPWMNWANMVSS